MNNCAWLSSDFLEWEMSPDGRTVFEDDLIFRPYEIWEHSKNLIETSTNDFQLSDGITNLKRAMNQRLMLIEDRYFLKTINYKNRPKGYLELLEEYGLVRPFLMKTLLTIRNDIEHNDAKPPNLERCKELLDVTWYFLKSTEIIVREQVEDIVFTKVDETGEVWIRINIKFDSKITVETSGWFSPSILLLEEKQNCIKVLLKEVKKKSDFKNPKLLEHISDNKMFITGELNLNHDDLFKMIKKSFTLY